MLPWRRAALVKFCRVVLPQPEDGAPAIDAAASVERHVAGLHWVMRLLVPLLFDALNVLPVFLGYFRPLMWMRDEAASRCLTRLAFSRFYLARMMFLGAKALVMLVAYADPAFEAWTGYSDDCLAARAPEAGP